ncbi:alpha/beta hydrolase [Oleomonas cavernae]|uniref:Alpha/beta hydrolase n=1 Tax=Oleomonas cavernae TaxID=2320859 RepID=A0A418VTR1_9PROT|nr:alpha/beta hydrolase [Oleomonas cavernae]RJF80526.1 alpha/beta hydrolase [Oleomonas cavernae]
MEPNCKDDSIDCGEAASMAVRIYRNAQVPAAGALVLHLHGGAFIGGSLNTGRAVSTMLADAGAVVISADYPIASGNPFPRALQSLFNVLKRLYKNRTQWAGKHGRLFVAGEEAGGNLAAALALMSRDQQVPKLSGQILLSPMLDPIMASCSIREAEAGPVGCKWADGWRSYLGTADKASHPYAAPVNASRLAGLAPALVLTAEDDPMRDESLAYARCLAGAGIAVTQQVLPGPSHWPDALGHTAYPEPGWAKDVRDAFARFFTLTTAAAMPVPA